MGNQVSKKYVCDACAKENHKNCQSRLSCDCACNVGGAADVTQKVLTIAAGVGAFAGGVFLTLVTGGLAIPVGGALMGAGVSATYEGIEKSIKEERLSAAGLAVDVAFGAATGVLTGGVGAAGETIAANVLKTGATEAAKNGAKAAAKQLTVRAGTGVVSGVAAKALDEVKTCATTDKEWKDFGRTVDAEGKCSVLGTVASWWSSAVVGALGGAAIQISSSASGAVKSGVQKAVVCVAVSGATASTADAVSQGINMAAGNQDEYDVKKTVLAGTVSGIMEALKNGVYASYGGKEQMLEKTTNRRLIDDAEPADKRAQVQKAYDDLDKVAKSDLQKEIGKAGQHTKIYDANADLQATKDSLATNYDRKIQRQLDLKAAALRRGDMDATKLHATKARTFMDKKDKQTGNINRAISKNNLNQVPKRDLKPLGKSNAHALVGSKLGQVAVDVKDGAGANRGTHRAVFDAVPTADGKTSLRFADYTPDHNYDRTNGFRQNEASFMGHHQTVETNLTSASRAAEYALRSAIKNLNEGSDDE